MEARTAVEDPTTGLRSLEGFKEARYRHLLATVQDGSVPRCSIYPFDSASPGPDQGPGLQLPYLPLEIGSGLVGFYG